VRNGPYVDVRGQVFCHSYREVAKAVLLLVLLSVPAVAEPLGPGTVLPGFDKEQSRMVYEEGSRILNDAQRKLGSKVGVSRLSGRALMCGLAGMMQGVIEAAAFNIRGQLTPSDIASARKAINYLSDIQAQNCDRTGGGGLGTGNDGDRLLKAFFDAHAPQARSILEEVRDKLGSILNADAARAARDAMLAAVIVAAGLVTAPLWAT
jgi:hypothetical protein